MADYIKPVTKKVNTQAKCPCGKYRLMSVTPLELNLRQTGGCRLELAWDVYEDGVVIPGALYCTDGKEYAETKSMLNPTFECMVCLTNFIMEMAEKHGKRD